MATLSIVTKLPAVDGIATARVTEVVMHEALNRVFELKLSLTIPARELKPQDFAPTRAQLIRQFVVVNVLDGLENVLRTFSGRIRNFGYVGFDHRGTHVTLTASPDLWFMGLNRDCQVNQNKSAADLLRQLAQRNQSIVGVSGGTQPIEYATQYRESDREFFDRICWQEGLAYHFEDTTDGGTLTVWNNVGACKPIAPGTLRFHADKTATPWSNDYLVQHWSEAQHAALSSFQVFDYRDDNSYDYNTRSKTIPGSLGGLYAPVKHSDYPGGHGRFSGADGTDYAQLLAEREQTQASEYEGTTTCPSVQPGKTFTLTDHANDNFNTDYLITSATHVITAGDDSSGRSAFDYHCSFTAVFKSTPYRPVPPAGYQRPQIHGIQTAMVMGPPHDTSTEIHTDDRARILVRFMWDQNQYDNNLPASCWIRVAQQWAGNQWGAQFIPRVGTEVLVSFVEGDPDRPIITGQVYNSRNQPIFSASESYKTGWRTRSTKQGGVTNFNELSFHDQIGKEKVYFHAEKDHVEEVENDHNSDIGHDETTYVHHDRTEKVDNNETIQIGVNRTESVGKDESINIGENRTESVGSNEVITVGKNRTEKVGQNENLDIGQNQSIAVGGDRRLMVTGNRLSSINQSDTLSVTHNLVVDVGDSITLRTGSASLTMHSDGTIALHGANITVNGSGSINITASADVVVKGSKTGIN